MSYNLEYHKQLDRSHILPNLLEGAKNGVIAQFLSDVIISLLLNNENIVLNDIKISEISSYYASVASGMVVSVLYIFMDPFAVVVFSITTYAFVYDLIESLTKNKEFSINAVEIVFDSIVSILLIYAFDNTAHSQYYRYWQKRCLIEPTIQRTDRSRGQSIFFVVLVSTYSFLKISQDNNEEKAC